MEHSRTRKLKSLLPASESSSSGSTSAANNPGWLSTRPKVTAPLTRAKRSAVKIACVLCRRKRIRCDGQRPSCGPCARKGNTCVYDSGEDEASTLSLKRKVTYLQHENLRYRDLMSILRSRTEPEAHEFVNRIRAAEDPLRVLDAVREAEIILPTPLFGGHANDAEVAALDQEAWGHSDIRVPARPWTAVAGDGLVSELVSKYFAWENAYFFPSISPDIFEEQMKKGDVDNASWCTPFLVSSICAHRSQTLGRAKIYSSLTRQDLTKQFLDEASSRFESEQGRISIPTAQALMLRYFTMTCMGMDRVGRAFRQQAIDMIHRLKIEARYDSLSVTSQAEVAEKKRISRALWGLFAVETRFAYFYLQPSQIPPPGIPRVFEQHDSENPDQHGNVDVLGRPFEDSSCEVPLVAGIFEYVYTLSELFYEVMRYNSSEEANTLKERDGHVRKRFYARLRQIGEGLPQRFLPNHNPSPSAIYLKMHLSEIGFAIIQNQSHNVLFELPASQPGTTIKDLNLTHCRSDIDMSEQLLSHWSFESCLWRHLYLSLQPLSLMLDDPEGRQLFTSASAIMRGGCSSFRICGYLLQATWAFTRAINAGIPEEALPHYEGCKENKETEDLPLSFALPCQDDVKDLLKDATKHKRGPSFSEENLGTLIETWTLHEAG